MKTALQARTWVFLSVLLLLPMLANAQMPSSGQIDPAMATGIPGIEVRQDWQVVCAGTACRAEPRVAPTPELSLSVVQDEGGAVLVLNTPLGLLLGEGVAVTVDGRALGRLGYMTCEIDGCVVPSRLDGALNRAMRGGTEMTLTLVRRDGSAITGSYSLIGFIAALDLLAAGPEDGSATP